MISHAPPYGLAPRAFPFTQLATLTARATLGATRETALACLMGARLVCGLLPPLALDGEQRRERAAAALAWLAALALPAEIRPALAQLFEATADTPRTACVALHELLQVVDVLDDPARGELDALAARLRRAITD